MLTTVEFTITPGDRVTARRIAVDGQDIPLTRNKGAIDINADGETLVLTYHFGSRAQAESVSEAYSLGIVGEVEENGTKRKVVEVKSEDNRIVVGRSRSWGFKDFSL